LRFAIAGFVSILALAPTDAGYAQATHPVSQPAQSTQSTDSTDEPLRLYAVHVKDLYGVYLGNGLIITAAHVVGPVKTVSVRVAGLNLSANVIKQGSFERDDLSLLAVDEQKLPLGLRMRRMPLCERPPFVGQPVIVAIPGKTARSRIMSPRLLPPDIRKKFPTVISDVATTGNSGSGVFDAGRKCLLGVMSRKFQARRDPAGKPHDLAKYFVPASAIRAFLPADQRF
jgi:hypothetical protein